ncbi:MAG: hypothetical protein JXA73_11975 [Acidobacteria bacterium]|nr:hypothetical protein [Acidobacteriota bacterium]
MKHEIDALVQSKGHALRLANPSATPKPLKRMLKGGKYQYIQIASSIDSSPVKVHRLLICEGPTAKKGKECIDQMFKISQSKSPSAKASDLSYSEWLGSGIYEVSSGDEKHGQLRLSREILIKRVANMLGASHPLCVNDDQAAENRFDPYIRDLHGIQVADGYPATFYQLLEIAGDILTEFRFLLENK